jgi:hypothetical protein
MDEGLKHFNTKQYDLSLDTERELLQALPRNSDQRSGASFTTFAC